MLFVIVGVVLIVLHIAGVGPMAAWTWNLTGDLWKFCLPFLLAIAWWAWADKSGLNKRREIERMDEKRRERRQKNLESLGIDLRNRRSRRPGGST